MSPERQPRNQRLHRMPASRPIAVWSCRALYGYDALDANPRRLPSRVAFGGGEPLFSLVTAATGIGWAAGFACAFES